MNATLDKPVSQKKARASRSKPKQEDVKLLPVSTVGTVTEGAKAPVETVTPPQSAYISPLEQLTSDIALEQAVNPLFAWQLAHGKLSWRTSNGEVCSRIKPSHTARLAVLLGFPIIDGKSLSGKGAALVARMNGAGMLNGNLESVRLIYSAKGADKSKMVSTISGSPIGGIIFHAMTEAIEKAVADIKQGVYPHALLVPISAKECGTGANAIKLWEKSFCYGENKEERWVLSTTLAAHVLRAFGFTVGGKDGLKSHQLPDIIAELVATKGDTNEKAE